jgi:hypothetical protein
MPSVQKGEKKDHYMHKCVPMLIKEGKKQDQAVAQCLNMFREHWQAKGNIWPDDIKEQEKLISNASWEDCPECIEMERHITGIWELNIASAHDSSIACSYCNAKIAMNYFQKVKRDDSTTVLVTKLPKEGKLPTEGFMASTAEMLPVPGSKLSPSQMFYFCNCNCRDKYMETKHIAHPMTDLPIDTKPNDKFVRLPSERNDGNT